MNEMCIFFLFCLILPIFSTM